MQPFSGDVEGRWFQSFGKLFDLFKSDTRSASTEPRASPAPQISDCAVNRLRDCFAPLQIVSSGSLSSGMDRSGVTSPLPIWAENIPDADGSRSRYSDA